MIYREGGMKILIAVVVLASTAGFAHAQGYRQYQGYTRQNGTYVQPHYQTMPDGNRFNNWSTRGNTNPFTGQPGHVNPYSNPSNSYGARQNPW